VQLVDAGDHRGDIRDRPALVSLIPLTYPACAAGTRDASRNDTLGIQLGASKSSRRIDSFTAGACTRGSLSARTTRVCFVVVGLATGPS